VATNDDERAAQALVEREAANEHRLAILENDVRDLQMEVDVLRTHLAAILARDPSSMRRNCPSCGRVLGKPGKCGLCGWKE